MLILGINGHTAFEVEDNPHDLRGHDSAAVLLRDGEVLAAIEEERLSRVKHCNFFPRRAIRACLALQGLTLADVDCIALNTEESSCEIEATARYLNDASCRTPGARQFYDALFQREFGVPVAHKLRFCNHHLAHAWSAYGPSGQGDSLVVVFDGEGDFRSGGVFSAQGGRLDMLRDYRVDQSLGHFYTSIIRLLGYNEFDQYKAMGLAPYGDPEVYRELFRGLYELLPEGHYTLADRFTRVRRLEAAGLLQGARRKGEPFTARHTHIAAALQAALEHIVEHVLRHFREATGHRSLCLSGGVAHNCSVNGKVLQWGLFDQVFVQPAAHDAGGALGAAWSVFHEERAAAGRAAGASPAPRLRRLSLGPPLVDGGELQRRLYAWRDFVSVSPTPRIARVAAALLAEGEVIGWVQGRSEFGPRALGHRSILADPRPAANKQRINRIVKKREAYRPFAPSVQEERLGDYFELPGTQADLSFMTYVLEVREPMRERLGAVTHVDGTARVQSVARAHNPLYWELIEEFGRLTGVHVVLNTSFNNDAEPIVDSIDDAIACFLTTGLDALVVGHHLLRRREFPGPPAHWDRLAPALPPSRKLVQAQRLAGAGRTETVFRIEGTMNRFFACPSVEIPVDAWHVLHGADGCTPLGELMNALGLADTQRRNTVIETLLQLWSGRFVSMRPPAQTD